MAWNQRVRDNLTFGTELKIDLPRAETTCSLGYEYSSPLGAFKVLRCSMLDARCSMLDAACLGAWCAQFGVLTCSASAARPTSRPTERSRRCSRKPCQRFRGSRSRRRCALLAGPHVAWHVLSVTDKVFCGNRSTTPRRAASSGLGSSCSSEEEESAEGSTEWSLARQGAPSSDAKGRCGWQTVQGRGGMAVLNRYGNGGEERSVGCSETHGGGTRWGFKGGHKPVR